MAKIDKKSTVQVCRHLGLSDDPFRHLDDPQEEHRCYLWMQRDRIDLAHQGTYCLTAQYRDCPWLQISLPCQTGMKAAWGEGLAPTLAALSTMAAETGTRLRPAASWAWANLRQALSWLGRTLPPMAGAALRGMGRGGRQLARAALRREASPRPEEPSESMPLQSHDFSRLMRLGREANLAGHRREAHLCFSKAMALDPTSEEVWLWLAASAEGLEQAQVFLERALAINPASGRARTQKADLPRSSTTEERVREELSIPDTSLPLLMEQGIKALDAGNEDKAYQFFTAATEADHASEAAWFWRAKTATDLGEVINCLERVLELNPQNQKAQASLTWALDRQRVEAVRQRTLASRLASPAGTTSYYVEPQPVSQPMLLHFASLIYLVLGILWILTVVFPLLDRELAALYRWARVLPIMRLPYLSSTTLGIQPGSVPEFNLLYLVPLAVAFLCFVAMEVLGANRLLVSFYAVLVTGISIVLTGLFVGGPISAFVLTLSSVLAGASALVGSARHQRQPGAGLLAASAHQQAR